MFETLVLERSEALIRVELNRPEALNALDGTMVDDLHECLRGIAADPTCRVVVLTGRGRGFCSGLDLQETRADSGDDDLAASCLLQEKISGLILQLRGMPQVVIAAVNGPAAGGGLALVLGSDIRIAGASATFSTAFIRIGLSSADVGTSWILPRLIGVGNAHELMLTGRSIGSTEALRLGLVFDVVPDAELLDRVEREAQLILRNSPLGVSFTKRNMWAALEIPGLEVAMELENRTQVMLSRTSAFSAALETFRQAHERNEGDAVG